MVWSAPREAMSYRALLRLTSQGSRSPGADRREAQGFPAKVSGKPSLLGAALTSAGKRPEAARREPEVIGRWIRWQHHTSAKVEPTRQIKLIAPSAH